MKRKQTPRARRKARAALERAHLIHNCPLLLNGGALFALRYVLATGGPVQQEQLTNWVQRLVNRELLGHGLPVAVRVGSSVEAHL